MSDDEPKDESTDDSEQQADEQATNSDQPAGQAEEQPTGADQPAEQSEEQPAESDQTAEQSEEQPAEETGQRAGQADDATGGGGPADDAVAADSGSKGNLKVIATFTQEGSQKFIGDIQILVVAWNNGQQGGLLFPLDPAAWQDTARKGNVIPTPIFPVATNKVGIYAKARVHLTPSLYQNMTCNRVFPIPSGDTLGVKFDVEFKLFEKEVNAPDAVQAKKIVYQSLQGHFIVGPTVKVEPIGKQQFRITGKYYTGSMSSPDGEPML